MAATEIGIVNFSGAQMAALLGLADLFAVADRLARRGTDAPDRPRLRISRWDWPAGEAAPLRVHDTAPAPGDAPAVLVLPPGLGEPLPAAEAAPYAAWLRARHGAGTILGAVCKGAFLLGETGLLAGRPVTIHWAYAEAFRARFPEARLDTGRPLIDDGDILTAGGVMAWTDLGLRLVERVLGPATMRETARAFLIDPPGRAQGDEAGFAPRLNHGDAAILAVQTWWETAPARATDLATLVARSGLEQRTFLRRFRTATGLTTTEYGQRRRIARARDLLQQGLTPDQAAWEIGYADPGAFRKLFTRLVGLTPAAYRRRFRG